MNRSEIKEKLAQIIEPYLEDKSLLENVSEDADLLSDLQINSANLIDIILDTEEAFDIEIDDVSAEKMFTLKDTIDIIITKTSE